MTDHATDKKVQVLGLMEETLARQLKSQLALAGQSYTAWLDQQARRWLGRRQPIPSRAEPREEGR